jgi:hypothetical protein
MNSAFNVGINILYSRLIVRNISQFCDTWALKQKDVRRLNMAEKKLNRRKKLF